MTPALIPLVNQSQRLSITLGTVGYNLIVQWSVWQDCWVMDILDASDTPVASGIPLVTGADLLGQLEYLAIGGDFGAGQLQVQTASDTFRVPTYTNLGSDGNLYWVTP